MTRHRPKVACRASSPISTPPPFKGNNGGQNQTGLSHDPAGTGSLQWTDLGGSARGRYWLGKRHGMERQHVQQSRRRSVELCSQMIVRISATDPSVAAARLA